MSLLRTLCLLCGLVIIFDVEAQTPYDEYYPYLAESDEYAPVIFVDSAIFYKAVQSADDLYARLTDYNLSFASLKRRGQEYTLRSVSVGGLELSTRYFTAFRSLLAEEHNSAGLRGSDANIGLTNGTRNLHFTTDTPLPARYASVNFTDRNYLAGAKLSVTQPLGHSWSFISAIHARTGRDMHVEGVFTNSVSVNLRAIKRFNVNHSLSLVVIIPPSMRGLRSMTTDEAFALTRDNLYNPSWGFQNGKVRNSHVRRDFVPMFMATYDGCLSKSTSLAVAVGAEIGSMKYSSLGWYDAMTPMPDNYRYMPSYKGDKLTEDAWLNNDTRYTQINWDELYKQNVMAGKHSLYAMEDRVERVRNIHVAANFTTDFGERLTIHYGIGYRERNSRNYKQMRDMLGGEYVIDHDQFLVGDDTYGNMLQNDLRNPNREIREGDRFGYDYEVTNRLLNAMVSVQYRSDRFKADVGVMIADQRVFRRGHYEKELFRGSASYGKSSTASFTPYTLKALLGWAFSPRSYIEAAFMAGAVTPDDDDMFLQPQYNNRLIDNPVTQKLYAAELNYNYIGRVVDMRVSAFATLSLDETDTRRYYDDISSTFCDMAVSGIGKLSYGLEASADIRIAYRWNVLLGASAGRYVYSRNPQVDICSDVDNQYVDMDAESRMGDCKVGGAPQLTGCAEVSYFSASGWGFRASANYAGLRYVEPMPLRRTERVAVQSAASREFFDEFTKQERLDDAFTLDASIFKSFRFGESRLTISLMMKNLLNNKNIVYNAYESLRVRRIANGDGYIYKPFDSRRNYAYPRSFYVTVSYKF